MSTFDGESANKHSIYVNNNPIDINTYMYDLNEINILTFYYLYYICVIEAC